MQKIFTYRRFLINTCLFCLQCRVQINMNDCGLLHYSRRADSARHSGKRSTSYCEWNYYRKRVIIALLVDRINVIFLAKYFKERLDQTGVYEL